MYRYKNKYRISSARLPSWDYSNSAAYFVTICTHNRSHFFGEIKNDEIQYSEIGKMAKQEWLKTFEISKDMNLKMGEFMVMPNHFHAIVVIGDNDYNVGIDGGGSNALLPLPPTETKNKFAPQSKNLASIIRGFKSSVTTYARKNRIDAFRWQSRFHDHIIRNDESFQKISDYIINNPRNW